MTAETDREAKFWDQQRALTVNRAPMCCPAGFDTETLVDPVKRTSRTGWAVLAIGILAIGTVLWATYARGAERLGKYEITLLYSGKDYDSVSRTFRTIGEPYETRTDCEVAITRVRILTSGARLRCDKVDNGRVN